jgi:SAM-dependent methyltransferase
VLRACPGCGFGGTAVFYTVRNVPVHSVLLMPTAEAARGFPRGDIELGVCQRCGFVSNTAFNPSAHSYSEAYEETQGFSPTFQAFHRRLARTLIDDYDVRGKRVVEIGCGKGEFLSLLCELGDNTGIGFDPAFVPERNPDRDSSRVKFIQEFYSEANGSVEADVICCKMTLEHIWDTRRFVETVRKCAAQRRDTLVFFQVPDFSRILHDTAFWDIYYEHCSYFTAASLKYLFQNAGFDVVSVSTDYDDQYLQIFAFPAESDGTQLVAEDPGAADIHDAVERFANRSRKKITAWDDMFRDRAELKKKAVLWGSGSKAVALLSALQKPESIDYVVDINPYRHGHYMAGTGQLIVGPEFLTGYSPDLVIAMNPIYRDEIQQKLVEVGCNASLLTM